MKIEDLDIKKILSGEIIIIRKSDFSKEDQEFLDNYIKK